MRLVKLVHYHYKYDSRIMYWSYYGLTESPVKSQLFCSIYKLVKWKLNNQYSKQEDLPLISRRDTIV